MIIFILTFIYIVILCIVSEILQKDYLLHISQLYNYRHFEYFTWLIEKDNIKNTLKKVLLQFILGIIFFFLLFICKNDGFSRIFSTLNNDFIFFLSILFSLAIITFLFFITIKRKRKIKKPLVYTKRAIRLKILYFSLFLFSNLLVLTIFLYPKNLNLIFSDKNRIIYILYLFLFSFFIFFIYNITPLIMLISQFIIYPVENILNNKFLLMAKKKIERLKEKGLIIIGITGSYGKTSIKNYIKDVLKIKYNLFASDLSYNTLMGISKNINDKLNEDHKIFISEMGARYKKDIEDLVKLCKPDIGVLSSIGPVHLQTFKNIENIINEKWKLIENSKIAFLNIDNDYIYQKAKETKDNPKFVYVGKQDFYNLNFDKLDSDKLDLNILNLIRDKTYIFTYGYKKERNPVFLVEQIELEEDKTLFNIKILNEKSYNFKTSLLGMHSAENLSVAIGLGFLFNIDYKDIYEVIEKIEPVEHRLQLIKPNQMLLIIDDAFNSNPDSASAALNVLKGFKDRKKIIITPGFIELGKLQYQKNMEFGKQISEIVDFAIFVGQTNKDALIEGFKMTNGDKNFLFAKTLEEATKFLSGLIDRSSVVLFENDLPDNYE